MIEVVKPVRRMPVWLSLLLIVASLAAGGAAIHWFLQTSTQAEDVVLDRDPTDSVAEVGMNHNSWRVKAGDFVLTITGKDQPRFEPEFRRLEGLSSEQVHFLSMTRRIANDRLIRARLELTDDQQDRLKHIREGAKVELSAQDKSQLAAALKQYLHDSDTKDAKAKDKAETALINAVEDVARPISLSAQKSAMERAEIARTLLTPEQTKIYQSMAQ